MWQHLFQPERAPWLIGLASILALATAFVSQYGFDLQPCVLCLYQRWPYGIVIALCILAVAVFRRGPALTIVLALSAVALAADAAIAGFHVGVEQHWWQGTGECTGPSGPADSVEALKAQIMATPVVRCDDIPFQLFGISMAGFNFLLAVALTAFAAAACWRNRSASTDRAHG